MLDEFIENIVAQFTETQYDLFQKLFMSNFDNTKRINKFKLRISCNSILWLFLVHYHSLRRVPSSLALLWPTIYEWIEEIDCFADGTDVINIVCLINRGHIGIKIYDDTTINLYLHEDYIFEYKKNDK
jgi:hypothetical protein